MQPKALLITFEKIEMFKTSLTYFFLLFSWINAAKFMTGASAVGSIAIPSILKHAGLIGWGALAFDLSSYVVFIVAILSYICVGDDSDNYYSYI